MDDGWGGYIIEDLSAEVVHRDPTIRYPLKDYHSIWLRDGKPDMKLPIRKSEIRSGTYLQHLNKYLLNDHDTSAHPDTNSHLALGWVSLPLENVSLAEV
jgi:hypothetical protein